MKRSPKIKEIVANRIVLKSPQGKLRVLLDASSEDATIVQLYGAREPLLVICIDSDGNPKMSLCHKTARVAISMGISDDAGSGMTLHDLEGRPVCHITVHNDGIPRIEMFQVISPTKGTKFWETPTPKTKRKKNGSSAK